MNVSIGYLRHFCTTDSLLFGAVYKYIIIKGKGKGKGQVLDIALLHDEHMLKSALQPRKWQLISMN